MRQSGSTLSPLIVDPAPVQRMNTPLPGESDKSAPDSELFIRRAFEQDARQGCELLFRRYYGALCSHAVRFVSSKAIAEDIVAEIFCQFFANRAFESITISYRAYLYQTVRHRAYNYLRQALHRDADLEEAKYQPTTESLQPDAITHYEELYQDVETAILMLPVQRRRIYLMHRFEGHKHSEIANELNISVRTVEVQVRKASHFLRNALRDKWTLLVLWGVFRHFS